jgi:predicted tellurium resistance membrane protein TerC
MFELLTSPEAWIALATLTALEVVLGIDNIIFISILSGKLPQRQQARARTIGLALAMVTRVLLLLSLTWIMRLTTPLIDFGRGFSGRDLILVAGGVFLVAKSTHEIHDKLEGPAETSTGRRVNSFAGVVITIMFLDIVFSLDSVITAVGMANHVAIMITAIVIAVVFMMFFSGYISRFVDRHPTIKMLALAFLLLIGVTLVAEGFGQHIAKGYIYFAMGFSVFVEMLNLRMRRGRAEPVKLHDRVGTQRLGSGV